jgi:MoaA/NifB/PqqE/SkfB family radical SAM enzyme
VTTRCNATCEFCRCWQATEQQGGGGVEDRSQKIFAELKIRGVDRLIITGGEPLLREDLPEILQSAKSFGFKTELTTNGILYAESAESINGLVDQLFFSLDYPLASEHDRSRGVECFNQVMAAIKRAKELKEKPVILFTLTRDSVRFLPEMVELSEQLAAPVCLNPVYDFHGTQGFEASTLKYIYYFSRCNNVLVNRAALEFIRSGGNKVIYPRCRAKDAAITLLPDGQMVSPCFSNRGGRQGREDVCSSCMHWPYMIPSFSLGIDKYFWLNLISEWANKRKLQRFYAA